jgi:hypothetical protein
MGIASWFLVERFREVKRDGNIQRHWSFRTARDSSSASLQGCNEAASAGVSATHAGACDCRAPDGVAHPSIDG